jgi:hypothetical protein
MNDLAVRIEQRPLATTIEYYAQRLTDSEKALSFLQRNLLSADVELKVGFADRTLGKQLPSHHSRPSRDLRKFLQGAGILKPTGHETFRGYVTVPLTDLHQTTTGIYGVRIDRHGAGEKIVTIGGGIFNASALQTFAEIILCDSLLDAWTFCGAGYLNAIAATADQLKQDDFASVKRVLLAGNADHDIFTGKELLRLNFPDDTCVNRYAIDNTSIDDCLGRRIRAASWISGAPTATTEVEPKRVAASPVPAITDDLEVVRSETEVTITIENRRWRIRGLSRNPTIGVLKVNVMVFNERTDRFHVDTLDLYHARSRRVFLKECGEEIAVTENDLRSDLGRVLLKLEQLQQELLKKGDPETATIEISDDQRSEAMELLQDEKLLDRILDDFETCGIVGEHAGKLAGYLAATSRLLEKPLGLVIQSSSAAGKSALADSVLRFMPPEQRFSCSAMTSQSLYYLGKENLRHKVLSVAEVEGVRDASYQLKLLQSEGRLSLVSTSKESGTGRTATERYDVEGPVALVMTTTSLSVDPELMNRCLVIAIDESAAQTEAILQQQRFAETIEGFAQELRSKKVVALHQNAQRCLRKLPVFNPYADQLGFIAGQTRHRRDHQKYLSLIKAVALLHQYGHEVKQVTINGARTEYLEVTRDDIAKANMIADWALGRSIDELSGPTRRLLVELYDWVREIAQARKLETSEVVFTRREAREELGWAATQLNYHLEQLCRFEYAVRCGGGNGKLCRYSLLYDGRGREGQAALIGLVDAASLVEPVRSTPTTDDLSG